MRPELWVFLKQQINKLPKFVAVGKVFRNKLVTAISDFANNLWGIFSRERSLQCAKLMQNAPKSPQITPGIVRLTFEYFGRSIAANYSVDRARLDEAFRSEILTETKVADLDLVAINKDIFRLKDAVDNLSVLQIGEC